MTSSLCLLQNDHLNLAVSPLGAEMQHLRTATGDDLLWLPSFISLALTHRARGHASRYIGGRRCAYKWLLAEGVA